jgi:hypothetical protein
MFSSTRIVSIVMLLAILIISLVYSSYVEGFEQNNMVDAVNEDAPKPKSETPGSETPNTKVPNAPGPKTPLNEPIPNDAIVLGKPGLSVSKITDMLKNNDSVKNMLTNLPVKK